MGDNNRMADFQGKNESEIQKSLENMQKELMGIAMHLYNIMKPGTTITLIIPDSKIITPGKIPKGGKLIISKPAVSMDFVVQK